jgi:hypothetical protein
MIRACDRSSRQVKKMTRDEFRKIGRIVRDAGASKFDRIDTRSAAGFRVRVRNAGSVTVEQTLRRVTGKRPDYGALQMKVGLVPAIDEKSGEVERRLEQALDHITSENF